MNTIRELLEWAVHTLERSDVFYGHGTDNPEDEALSLILYVLGLDYSIDESVLDRQLTDAEVGRIRQIIDSRIATRKPAPYITQRIWFAGHEFYIDESALIPRSPIAELILSHYAPWIDLATGRDARPVILDLCTGSGCIAVATALEIEHADVVATDISDTALSVAARNIARYALQDRVELVKSDLFANLAGRKFDLIVSNPPYVSSTEMTSLPMEYMHEPRMALEAAQEGLEIVVHILQQAADYLKPGGVLIVEVGNSQDALVQRYPEVPFTWIEFENGGAGVFTLTREQLPSI